MTEFDELMKKLVQGARGWFRDLVMAEIKAANVAAALAATPPVMSPEMCRAEFDPDSVGIIVPAKVGLGGHFVVARENDDGSIASLAVAKNMVTNGALDDVLEVYLRNGTQKTTWYLGLVDNSGFSALAAGDTMSSHAGWTELTTYSQATRPAWGPDAASGQTMTNSTSVTFTASGTIAVNGCFLTSGNGKGGTSGTLFATGSFSAVQNLTSGQNLKVTYTCPASAT